MAQDNYLGTYVPGAYQMDIVYMYRDGLNTKAGGIPKKNKNSNSW